jgi:hypothetical protein
MALLPGLAVHDTVKAEALFATTPTPVGAFVKLTPLAS